MTASAKSKRTPPVNRFEDYVLNYEAGPNAGLYPVKNAMMTYLPGTAGQPSQDDEKQYLEIGFTFQFDQKKYNNLLIATNGWAILVDDVSDSSQDGTAGQDVFGISKSATASAPTLIMDSFGSTKHILLCPWFDDMRTVARLPNDSAVSAYLSAIEVTQEEISLGKKIFPPGIDSTLGGIKYYRGVSHDRGKCLVVRWKTFARFTGAYNVVNFDLVLYESGEIEFRYIPRSLLRGFEVDESAAIGIFANGESVSQPRYRDMSVFVGAKDARGNYENGGAIYKTGYTDPSNGTKFNSSLDTYNNWPGQGQFGAIFSLSPPALKRRQIRSAVSLRSSVTFAGGYSMFDDRNVIPFVTGTVEYPSMLPVNFKVDNESDQPQAINRLFQSGSIRVTRVVKSGLYESPLLDSMIETNLRSR